MSFAVGAELVFLLRQLEEEGFVELRPDGATLSWADYYTLLESDEHGGTLGLLGLPSQEAWRPALSSRGTLTDTDFAVGIQGWLNSQGQRPNGNVTLAGGVLTAGGKSAIISEAAWRMTQAIAEQRNREGSERTPDTNKRDWSTIRGHASRAGADLTDYLRKTVVLTPERLRIDLRKGDVVGDKLVEVMPGFDGAPPRWLELFDRFDTVPERYEIPDGNGLVHVLLSDEARTVLREIRRMPGRRIAGERAEAFVRNPFATLGPDATKVIDPEQFERAREDAGIVFACFTAKVSRDDKGRPYEVALIIEETLRGAVQAEQFKFEGPVPLESFLKKLERKIADGAQCCHWDGFDLEILGDTPRQAALLRGALNDWRNPSRISASDIFDLSKYSERVGGFGVEKAYYSPFIAKKSEDAGWFPENIDLGLFFTPADDGDTVAVALDDRNLSVFRAELDKARQEKRETFDFPGCPKPVPVSWAIDTLETLGQVREEVEKGSFDPKKTSKKNGIVERRGLVVKPNVDSLDYEERRGALANLTEPAALPSTMLSHIELKEHQLYGVAWLQHLWSHSPNACRGALLADDMGLGKTIQLLTFMAAAIEREPGIDPFLVVAPVSLLENWKEEITKFFSPGAMKVLTLYGPDLAAKRVHKSAFDEGLIEAGSPKLLTLGWLGTANVVLTTYETLRDLEFSLAAQRWSAMICDEAQKIKNPNALVTRAAKKQNARLKIACTGTPVENTLTDIWCLFDFIQPGLLGALKDFGSKYRKPIESETDDEKIRIEELRNLIEPQKLRRTKAEVAKDLPKKIEFDGCRALPLSQRQRSLYADAVAQFRARPAGKQATGMQSPLGLLQYLRRLCSDPRSPGHLSTASEPLPDIVRDSPKMAWMLSHLKEIKKTGEKAIVFCEFRDLQRTLQRAISERFEFMPDVINGDTSADSANANNRQKRLKAFQERPGFGVIILSPLAVGFGVNIQAANHVIHFTRTWNPAKEDQATDRAYRIGQTRDVYVYYPVVVAHDFLTFDAKLDKLLDKKRALSTDMLNGAGDVSPADFGDLEAPDGGNAFSNQPLVAEDIGSMDGDTFEAFCALLWSKMGYSRTIKTKRAGDGGVDVVAIKSNEGALIQCKSSTIESKGEGWEAVKDVYAGSAAYGARYPGIVFSMLAVTNRRFNQAARSQAKLLKVELIEGDQLAEMLASYPMKRGELDRFLLAGWTEL
ncbi:restriction endonuclease [Herminiimonas contaminans]|uniref:Restriction endonuclease n=1 Tax=Herminiimonas contaminans TaxID=1111140 RepID=A0ABS0EU97_9BURK|nr:restriction endonuclease [Herminiimonas contaminans]